MPLSVAAQELLRDIKNAPQVNSAGDIHVPEDVVSPNVRVQAMIELKDSGYFRPGTEGYQAFLGDGGWRVRLRLR